MEATMSDIGVMIFGMSNCMIVFLVCSAWNKDPKVV